jgi:hypothetical protein
MALSVFNEEFQLRYQDVLTKKLVAMRLATTELRSNLKYGDTVHRPKIDTSLMKVRDVTRYVDRTIPQISDSDQTMVIDQQKAVDFALDDWDSLQAGPLTPGDFAGEVAADKLKQYIDADVLYQTLNSAHNFDTGNLAGTSANGTPIVLSTTNAPQMATQMMAFMQAQNITGNDWLWVLDPYAVSILAQHAIGKDLNMSEATYRNGFSGPLVGSDVLISNNLTGEAVLSLVTQVTANDTVTIGGVTFTFVASPSVAGDVDIGANVDGTRANLAAAINGGAGAGTAYIEVSAANRTKLSETLRITATNDDTANTLTIVGKGSGRLSVAEALTDATDTWTKNFIHAYAGLANSIDLVAQQDPRLEQRDEPKQRTTNYLTDALYGVKVFDDRAQRFVDVHIAA